MLFSISGINLSIPTDYEEIIRRLRALGLSPTGNYQIDKNRLQAAIQNRVEKFELEKKELEEYETERLEEHSMRMQQEENKLGAQILGEQNKFFFGL